MKHWYLLQRKLQPLSCCGWVRATKEREARTESPGKAEIPESLIGHPTNPMTLTFVMLMTTWLSMQAKAHSYDLWKKGCCRESLLSQAWRELSSRLTKGHRRIHPTQPFKIYNLIKTNLYLCNPIQSIFLRNNVFLVRLALLFYREEIWFLLSQLCTLPRLASKLSLEFSPHLPLQCNLGFPTVMDTHTHEWEPSPAAPATILWKNPNQIPR